MMMNNMMVIKMIWEQNRRQNHRLEQDMKLSYYCSFCSPPPPPPPPYLTALIYLFILSVMSSRGFWPEFEKLQSTKTFPQ